MALRAEIVGRVGTDLRYLGWVLCRCRTTAVPGAMGDNSAADCLVSVNACFGDLQNWDLFGGVWPGTNVAVRLVIVPLIVWLPAKCRLPKMS